MFPNVNITVNGALGFPRVSGDVPWGDCSGTASALFSPRERGCSDLIMRGIVSPRKHSGG